MICALRISQAGLESHAKVGALRDVPWLSHPCLSDVFAMLLFPAAVCRVISVTSLAKQKLSPYKYGNPVVELSLSWDKLKVWC